LVYLIKKIDDAWLYGQCAGYEGMFPSNFVNIVVPLQEESLDDQNQPEDLPPVSEYKPRTNHSSAQDFPTAEALYQFDAETESDLNLRVRVLSIHN
jgi:hypothetical protein